MLALITSKQIGCHLSPGKGSHGKATAPNGKVWTVPSEWDGSIPYLCYQHLNDLIEHSLDIEPSTAIDESIL